jgi:hypothetical protein
MDGTNRKTYVTLKKSRACNLPQNVTVTTETTKQGVKGVIKKRRIIRYVETLDSIFVDEQDKVDPNAKQTNKAFIKGILRVDEEDHVLIKYIETLPHNIANGGKMFKEYIIDEEDKFEIERYNRIVKASSVLMEAEENLVRAFGVEFIGAMSLGYTNNKIKMAIRPLIDADSDGFIERFMKFSKSNMINEKIALAIALNLSILEIHNGKNIRWAIDGRETIYAGTQAGSVMDEVAAWFKTDKEGQTTLASVAKKIKEHKK